MSNELNWSTLNKNFHEAELLVHVHSSKEDCEIIILKLSGETVICGGHGGCFLVSPIPNLIIRLDTFLAIFFHSTKIFFLRVL